MADHSDPSEIPPLVTSRELQRILAAVGARFVPADLDRDRLAVDLSQAVFGYEVRRLLQDPPTEEAVQARLRQLEKQIDGLYKELPTSRNRLDWELLNILDNSEGAFHGFVANICAQLRMLKMIVARKREQGNAVITPSVKEAFGAEYWLFGQELATTFARHFQREAGYSRLHTHKAGGPYVRFALAAGVLLGVRKSTGRPYGAETIVKALAAYRKLGKAERDID
jgi:hypothetical protein